MKLHYKHILMAGSLAFGLALLMAMPVFAEGEPPPEAPAAPFAAAPAAPDEPDIEHTGEDLAGAPLGASGNVGASALKIWFEVGGITYDDYDTLQEAIDDITLAGLPGDRTIHVEAGTYDTDGDYLAVLDGAQPYLAQVKVIRGPGGFPNNNGAAIFDGSLEVTNTTAGFTIQGLQFEGALTFQDNTGALNLTYVDLFGGGSGLIVDNHNGAVKLDSVNVLGGDAAYINNTDSPGAGVTVLNSAFSWHGGGDGGLEIVTNGMATLTGVSASNNDGVGADIMAQGGVKLVHGIFNYNYIGLTIDWVTNGSVYLEDIVARDNDSLGAYIVTASKGLTIKQAGLSNNGSRGIAIRGDNSDDDPFLGAVTLVDVGAWGNGEEGIYVRSNGAVALTRVDGGGNQMISGIYITTPGAITLNSVSANNNGNGTDDTYGVVLNNQFAGSSKGVTITDAYYGNSVSDNRGNGLWIRTNGAVSIKGLDASGNQDDDTVFGYGIRIEGGAASNVSLTDVRATENDQYGVYVSTLGTITWKGGEASRNGYNASGDGFGAQLLNFNAATPKAVTLENLNFDDNEGDFGLFVDSKGAINAKWLNANGNSAGKGAILDNNRTGASGGVSVTGSKDRYAGFAGNGEAGLDIQSLGVVTVHYGYARENGSDGLTIANTNLDAPAAVNLTYFGSMDNDASGIVVQTSGAVNANSLYASDNVDRGLFIDSSLGTGAVKLLRSENGHNNFSGNGEDGVKILARGAVTLARMMANENGGYGAYIDNCLAQPDGSCAGNGGVTFLITSGWNHDFSQNDVMGLYVQSKGAILLSNVNAFENESDGAVLDNNWLGANGAVTIGSVGGGTNNFSQNGGSGLQIFSTGAISLSNYDSSENYGYGAHLNNVGATSPKAVTVLNGYARDNTNGDGLRISSLGNIKVTSVSSEGNDGRDMNLEPGTSVAEWLSWENADEGDAWKFTLDAPSSENIILHLYNQFEANLILQYFDEGANDWMQYGGIAISGEDELEIDAGILPADQYRVLVQADGGGSGDYVLSITDASAENLQRNGASGFNLSNSYEGGAGTIILLPGATQQQVVASRNSASGVIAFSRKGVTITSVNADWNSGRGVIVDNCLWDDGLGGCAGSGAVTINGVNNNLNNNTWDGLYVYSNGAVSLLNVSANENGWGYTEKEDWWDGIFVDTSGNVSLNTSASNPGMNWLSNNGNNGLYVDTAGTITVNKIEANGNGTEGAQLDNTYALTPKAVTVTNSRFDDNNYGMDIYTIGTVTLTKVNSNNNDYDGVYILNMDTSAPVSISQSEFSGNQDGYGISVDVLGNITWNSSSAYGNADQGALLDNDDGGGTVTLLGTFGTNNFYSNDGIGLEIWSFNRVSVSSTRAGYSTVGAYINAQGPVTISSSIFENNWEHGLNVESGFGFINLNNVSVFGNALGTGDDYAGAILSAYFGNITIANSSFSGNGDAGLSLGFDDPLFGAFIAPTVFYYGNDLDGDANWNDNLEYHALP